MSSRMLFRFILLYLTAAGCSSHALVAAKDAASPGSDAVANDSLASDPMASDVSFGRDDLPPDAAVDNAFGDSSATDAAPDGDLATPDQALVKDIASDTPSDASPGDPPLAEGAAPANQDALVLFCTGSTPRMVVNGIATTPTVVGQELALDCCDAGRFVVTTSDFSQPIGVDWRVQVGSSTWLPASIDIGSLPAGWGVRLSAGCSVTSTACFGALDNFASGFAGSLSVGFGDGGHGMDMGLCMHFEEPADKPGYYLHTLDLYAPHISTSW